jgi:hypothetical protein
MDKKCDVFKPSGATIALMVKWWNIGLRGIKTNFMKHPARQYTDDEAYRMTEDFINGRWGNIPDEMPDYRRRQRQQAVAEG